MYTGRIYAVTNKSELLTAASRGLISVPVLFGSTGEDGLIVECSASRLRASVDGTALLLKFYPYGDRSPTVESPLDYLVRRASEAGVTFTLYSQTPVAMDDDGVYTDCPAAGRELPLIAEILNTPAWRSRSILQFT